MRLNKLLLSLLLICSLYISLAYAFTDPLFPARDCSTDSADYVHYNDSGINWTDREGGTNPDPIYFDTAIKASNTTGYTLFLENWRFNNYDTWFPRILVQAVDGSPTCGAVYFDQDNILDYRNNGSTDVDGAYQGLNSDMNLTWMTNIPDDAWNFSINNTLMFKAGCDNNALNHSRLFFQEAEDNSSITGMYIWSGSNGCPLAPLDTTPPINSSWNVTSGNVPSGESTTIWNIGGLINITNNTLSLTVTTDENANGSCVLDQNWNYTYAVSQDPNYKFATTETTSHAYTVYDNISVGNHCLYCSFVDGENNEFTNSSTGCLNVRRTPIVVPIFEGLEVSLPSGRVPIPSQASTFNSLYVSLPSGRRLIR